MNRLKSALGLLIAITLSQFLHAQVLKTSNIDEEFYSVLHGFDANYEMGSNKWKEKLVSIVNKSSSKNHVGAKQQNQLESAMEKFPAPRDASQDLMIGFSDISRAYNKIRIQSPDSAWFKQTRFPHLLQSLMNKFSPAQKEQTKKQDPVFCRPES